MATPLTAVTTPRDVVPSKNSTFPVIVFGVTVAVNVMLSLSQAGLLSEVTDVDVGPCANTDETKNENKKKKIKKVQRRHIVTGNPVKCWMYVAL